MPISTKKPELKGKDLDDFIRGEKKKKSPRTKKPKPQKKARPRVKRDELQMRPGEKVEKLYSVRETLHVLSISRPTLYRLISNGEITPLKIGKKTLFTDVEIQRFIGSKVRHRMKLSDTY